MKNILVVVLLVSAVACGGKNKGASTPANKDKATEMKTGATGGAAYGGPSKTAPAPNKDAANPCAPN